MRWFLPLLVVVFYSTCISAYIHTFKRFCTASSDIPNIPDYMETDTVDGVVYAHYDSNTQRRVPMQQTCLKVDPDYWNIGTMESLENQMNLVTELNEIKRHLGHTGMHVFQMLFMCKWDNESEDTCGTSKSAYDGMGIISPAVKTTKENVNVSSNLSCNDGLGINKTESAKNDPSVLICKKLQYYVEHGKQCLEWKDPLVSVFLNHTSPSSAVCHATGFYPEAINITWKRDGEEVLEDVDVRETLPNGDGTFQKRVVLTVSPEERKKSWYTCKVAHASGVITKTLTRPRGTHLPIIGGVVVVVVFIAFIAYNGYFTKCRGHRNNVPGHSVGFSGQGPVIPAGSEEPLMPQAPVVRIYSTIQHE